MNNDVKRNNCAIPQEQVNYPVVPSSSKSGKGQGKGKGRGKKSLIESDEDAVVKTPLVTGKKKEKKAVPKGVAAVGSRVAIYWHNDEEHFKGTIGG